MKTAMQELIEKLHARCEFCLEKELISEWGTLRMTIIEAQSLLEKEKEQLMNAWVATDNKLQRLAAEQYYNQTYNQKQHIIDIMKADEDDGLYNQNES